MQIHIFQLWLVITPNHGGKDLNLQKGYTMANILDQEMFSYFSLLKESEKKSIVQMLKTFLKSRREDASRISIEQYNIEIDTALEETETGNYVTQDEMEKIAGSWKEL